MRLRCPHQGCSINVADDLVGARIRCPHCEQFLVVDPRYQEAACEQVQPGMPSLSLGPEPRPAEPANPEHRVHAGLPPLSVMLAVRAGRAPAWKDDGTVSAEMTADDWTALAAFEKVLYAIAALQTSLWVGIATATSTLLLALVAAQGSSEGTSLSRDLFVIATAVFFSAGFLCMETGRRRFKRLQIGAAVELAAWASLAVALAFTMNPALALLRCYGERYGPAPSDVVLACAAPLYLTAAIAATIASVRVRRALNRVSPSAILHRLTEALQYLE